MLVRLLYASKAAEGVNPSSLLSILRKSRSNNTKLGVTGVLCHADQVFMQVLEGGRAQVNLLYNAIARDPRHREVQLMSYEEVPERRFSGWAMGQVALDQINPAQLLKYSEFAKLDPFAASGRTCVQLLEDLVASAAVVGQ